MRVRRPTLAETLAVAALVFACSSSAVAASRYLITSPSQIKPSVLRSLAAQANAKPIEVKSPFVGKPGAQPAVSAHVYCPNGTHVISGGYRAEFPPGMTVRTSVPLENGWLVVAYTGAEVPVAASAHVQAYALCVRGNS